jgi:hypothetical protein
MSSFHNMEVTAKSKWSVILKPRCVVDCNCAIGRADLGDQALE